MRGSCHSFATSRCGLRIKRYRPSVDTFVLDRSHAASRVLRTDVTDVVSASVQPVLFGVPQGSVLGPLLCVYHRAHRDRSSPWSTATHVCRRLPGLHQHVRQHIPVPQAVDGFTTCVADVNAWLTTNRLRLNASKTVLLWLCSSQLLEKVTCKEVLLLGIRVAISDSARDLGIIIDRELSLEAHVTAVCRAG